MFLESHFLIRSFHDALVLYFRGEYFMFNKLNVKNVLLKRFVLQMHFQISAWI